MTQIGVPCVVRINAVFPKSLDNNIFHHRYVLMGDILETTEKSLGQTEIYLKDYAHGSTAWTAA